MQYCPKVTFIDRNFFRVRDNKSKKGTRERKGREGKRKKRREPSETTRDRSFGVKMGNGRHRYSNRRVVSLFLIIGLSRSLLPALSSLASRRFANNAAPGFFSFFFYDFAVKAKRFPLPKSRNSRIEFKGLYRCAFSIVLQ